MVRRHFEKSVVSRYLAEGKIEPEVVQNMHSWQHSGFGVEQSESLSANDRKGVERLVHYVSWCPFSLSRLVKVTDTGQVVHKPDKQSCRAFPA